MERLRYYLREGLKNIWTNRIMTVASLGVLTVCLLLLGSSWLISENVKSLVAQVSDKNQIMAYLKLDIDQSGVTAAGDAIRALPHVKNVTFVSKEEALQSLKKQFGDQADLLAGLEKESDFLPGGYQVEVDGMEHYSATVKALRAVPGVERVNDNSPVAQKLVNINRVIYWVGIWLFAILAVISLFLISNTIKLSVFVRRREINIMKFVGATDNFIRWPFVVEGVMIGLIAGLIALSAQYYVYNGLVARLFSVLNVTPVVFHGVLPFVAGGFILSGIAMGALGSVISMRRYLNV